MNQWPQASWTSGAAFNSRQPPLRQVLVHNSEETIFMMPLDQMREFVNNDILEALFRLLGEFGIETDSAGSWVAATPLGFHPLHVEPAHRDVEPWFPRF